MTTAAVHVVVVNWNAAAETAACVASLQKLEPPVAAIHVVDNGSVDESVAAIRAAHPGVLLHRNPVNLGFAGGANVGIQAALDAGAAWIFLLNNDARVEAGAIAALLRAAARSPAAGLLGGKIFRSRSDRLLWACGVSFRFGPNIGELRGHGTVDSEAFDREENVDSLTGCGLLVRREVFEKIGLLDDSYFAYVEDADFAMRARNAGFACRYVPDAVMEHPGGGSTGGGYSVGRKYLTAHGAARFLRRHGTARTWLSFWVFDVLLWPVLLIQATLRGDARAAIAKLRGTVHGLTGRPADLRVLERRR